mmetsp:Transcript_39116/g.123487  ORF Transcript_39116/g.123487 Transcript_39116/m.123487 type:complete len:234 (-) Transcript_39116:435-1136(-)
MVMTTGWNSRWLPRRLRLTANGCGFASTQPWTNLPMTSRGQSRGCESWSHPGRRRCRRHHRSRRPSLQVRPFRRRCGRRAHQVSRASERSGCLKTGTTSQTRPTAPSYLASSPSRWLQSFPARWLPFGRSWLPSSRCPWLAARASSSCAASSRRRRTRSESTGPSFRSPSPGRRSGHHHRPTRRLLRRTTPRRWPPSSSSRRPRVSLTCPPTTGRSHRSRQARPSICKSRPTS